MFFIIHVFASCGCANNCICRCFCLERAQPAAKKAKKAARKRSEERKFGEQHLVMGSSADFISSYKPL